MIMRRDIENSLPYSPPLFAGASLKLGRAFVRRATASDSPPLFAGASLKRLGLGTLGPDGQIPPRFSRGPH